MLKLICIGHFASEIGTAHVQVGGLWKPHICNRFCLFTI